MKTFLEKIKAFGLSLIKDVSLTRFAIVLSLLNYLFYAPFFKFVVNHTDPATLNGILIIGTLILLVPIANFFVFYLLLFLTRIVGKVIIALTFIISAGCLYFINTYHVLIDKSMMGNVFNTQYSEASGFFSFMFIAYIVVLGILPTIYIFKAKVKYDSWKRFGILTGSSVAALLMLVFANTGNFLWIDKYSTELGALTMPYSYIVNSCRYWSDVRKRNQKEIPLPDATIHNEDKTVVVLIIGESARRQNFSLYGYEKNTNPLLAITPNVAAFPANASATYTTAGVKAILDHKPTRDLYEILPNYLYRNGVDVVWRTTNWGEPPVHIEQYQKRAELASYCPDSLKQYDEVLLANLQETILTSQKDKILIVLHTSVSHGPQYSQRYPATFEHFQPVCNSVELANCTNEELMNAYDNTIVYTDYLLHRIISELQALSDYQSAMLFVSDHGESLGESNLYMHGVPMAMAPKEQYEIPFIVWISDNANRTLKPNDMLSHYHVFHSVMNFLALDSPIYNEEMNIFE